MRPATRPLFWTAAVVTVLALPTASRAQQPLDPVQVSARTTEADRLDAQAAAYEETGSRRAWSKAAGLREKAAGLRTPEDPRAAKSLETAALIRHALNQRSEAIGLMRRAGDHAIARGDVYRAATAYVNVAFLAAEMRDAERMREYAAKGSLLMHSPLLSAPQRESLQRSLAESPSPARQQVAEAIAATRAP